MNFVKNTDKVLIVWDSDSSENVPEFVETVKTVASEGEVALENSERIVITTRPHSSFDIVLSNWVTPYTLKHTNEVLAIILKLLKPKGKLIAKSYSNLITPFKLNGFVNVCKGDDCLYIGQKPDFEVGSKAPLKFANKPTAVWKLDNTVEEAWLTGNDGDLIDDSKLLDEKDLTAPDKKSLRVCSTTGQRKACADCSCGLAEELRGEAKGAAKSSCGSCYLGDAFRCATCPYLGMPAFKPGEKIELINKPDYS